MLIILCCTNGCVGFGFEGIGFVLDRTGLDS